MKVCLQDNVCVCTKAKADMFLPSAVEQFLHWIWCAAISRDCRIRPQRIQQIHSGGGVAPGILQSKLFHKSFSAAFVRTGSLANRGRILTTKNRKENAKRCICSCDTATARFTTAKGQQKARFSLCLGYSQHKSSEALFFRASKLLEFHRERSTRGIQNLATELCL